MIDTVRERTGCTEVKAIEIVTVLLDSMEDALLSGSSVLLSGIGTITPEMKRGGSVKMFGEEREIESKLKLTLKTSRVFSKKHNSKRTVNGTDIRKVGDLFLSNKK